MSPEELARRFMLPRRDAAAESGPTGVAALVVGVVVPDEKAERPVLAGVDGGGRGPARESEVVECLLRSSDISGLEDSLIALVACCRDPKRRRVSEVLRLCEKDALLRGGRIRASIVVLDGVSGASPERESKKGGIIESFA